MRVIPLVVAMVMLPAAARAQAADAAQAPAPAAPGPTPAPAPAAETASPPEGSVQGASRARVTLAGYVEAFYQWNFNNPSNGITNLRGFDTRHNAFTLSNAVLDATGVLGPVALRLALQVGHTPETYYLAEPDRGASAGSGVSNRDVWKYLQQANVGWRASVGRGLLLEAGLFTSPIGPEGFAVKDQWNWSRSNLFFGLPFYHAGLRVSYPFSEALTVTLAGYNGWNCVVDNNDEKSVSLGLDYVTDRWTFHALYFGGVERAADAPERQGTLPWRHLLDVYVQVNPRPWLSLLAHGNAGVEPNAFGASWWAAGALYARVRARRWLFVTARGDVFYERSSTSGMNTAASIFWPGGWVSSGTATLDARPHDNVSLRLEYRHDEAGGDTWFRGTVSTPPGATAPAPNSPRQDTVTLGMTAWF
ncbi:MAG: porin [Deltaproteobacteria bacterium]|nr:porin [Deltaproteobacteria bacterium]